LFVPRKPGYHARVGRVLAPLLLASGLLLAAVSACQDDSVYRSGVVPTSTTDGGTGDDGSVANDADTGTD
jgi:hypothetical protein